MHSPESEKSKYEKIWAVPGYRVNSPGEGLVDRFAAVASRGSLIDLGCGTGRAGVKLRDLGFDVTLFDLTKTALDKTTIQAGLPFIEGNLWGSWLFSAPFDWIYCTDVLEHIPPEHIDATLDNMAWLTGLGGFLQIAMFEDGFGSYIGDRLHLTIQPADWWMAKISSRWEIKFFESAGGRLIVFLGRSYGKSKGDEGKD